MFDQMYGKPYKRISVSRPKDESLEGYKAWVRELAEKLEKNAEVHWTEEEWVVKRKKFGGGKPTDLTCLS